MYVYVTAGFAKLVLVQTRQHECALAATPSVVASHSISIQMTYVTGSTSHYCSLLHTNGYLVSRNTFEQKQFDQPSML